MYRSSGRIRSLSVEFIDCSEDFEIGTLTVERYVSDPHDEIIILKTDDKTRILIGFTEKQRRVIQFQLCGCPEELTITLWDLMELFEIRCGHHSLIVALKKCPKNILFAIEMERGILFCLENLKKSKSKNSLYEIFGVYGKSTEEVKVEKKASVFENKIKNSIVTNKRSFIKQLQARKKKKTNNTNESNKITVLTKNQSSSQKIAQFVVDGVVTYTFYMTDYCCLAQGEWLNDLIIDWYLMYLYSKVISNSDRERTFIYSALFFAVLRKEAFETKYYPYGAIQRFTKIRQFTGKVNIFEKDFVIIPVNEQASHWYLIVICFLGLVGDHQIDDASQSMSSLSLSNDDDHSEKKYPCILIFDSLKNSKKKDDIFLLREYLSFQYSEHYKKRKFFSESVLSCDYPSIPTQTNYSDCGIFVLQYVESFFKNPIKNFTLPIKSLKKWFPPEVVREKRAYLAHILRKMSNDTIGQVTPINFPELRFSDDLLSDDDE
ncbi:sentrin-specific protease 6-like [Chelonus insularis]|uniref:sentrin-specific protease 6-like n=1 Tax=Chelonus insularis TaxID=460826 RepID=UPI00158B54E5|nr:sentrin-specific protease 6-like [Chelonus insularis]